MAPSPGRLSFGEAPPFSIEALWGKMNNLLAWSDQLHVELDIDAAHRHLQVECLVAANQEMSVQFDQLQAKFDHFIDEHWCPMQHFACGVVSCLAVFAGDLSFKLPFNVGTGSKSGTPFPLPPLFRIVSGCGWIGRISRTMAALETSQDPPYEASEHCDETSQHRRETSQRRRDTSQLVGTHHNS